MDLGLRTKEYACEQGAGRFLHHNPKPGGGARDWEKIAWPCRLSWDPSLVVWLCDAAQRGSSDEDALA